MGSVRLGHTHTLAAAMLVVSCGSAHSGDFTGGGGNRGGADTGGGAAGDSDAAAIFRTGGNGGSFGSGGGGKDAGGEAGGGTSALMPLSHRPVHDRCSERALGRAGQDAPRGRERRQPALSLPVRADDLPARPHRADAHVGRRRRRRRRKDRLRLRSHQVQSLRVQGVPRADRGRTALAAAGRLGRGLGARPRRIGPLRGVAHVDLVRDRHRSHHRAHRHRARDAQGVPLLQQLHDGTPRQARPAWAARCFASRPGRRPRCSSVRTAAPGATPSRPTGRGWWPIR